MPFATEAEQIRKFENDEVENIRSRYLSDKIQATALREYSHFIRKIRINKYIANKPFKYIILGDEKELDLKALEKIAPIRKVTTEEIFGY